jgi:membrane protein insertase Oxa1/YidC/SpoIIIJ
MAEKMPSFKHGGALWFTDLSTPDALYIFPVITALSFLVVVEVSTSFPKTLLSTFQSSLQFDLLRSCLNVCLVVHFIF